MSATEPIAAATHMGAVHLTVADLERSLEYYRESIGLDVLKEGDGRATLGAGTARLLELVEVAGRAARPGPHRPLPLRPAAAGPPQPRELGRARGAQRVRLAGASDHFVSEAIYLSDPDRHGIEIYADRPRELWDGQVAERMGTDPLDLDGLLGELGDPQTAPFDGQPLGTTHGPRPPAGVADPPAVEFYRDLLGFGLMAEYGGQAAFLSAGGYHHHVGANTWRSGGAGPPEPGAAALRRFEIVLPGEAERDRLVERLGAAGQAIEEHADGPLRAIRRATRSRC